MKKISVNFEHCYGINKLQYDFDFEKSTFSVYAPNGAMKTSFAKTFKDIRGVRLILRVNLLVKQTY